MLMKEGFLINENGEEKDENVEKSETKKDVTDIHSKIISFFSKNPNPKDDKVHEFAKSLGMEPDDFEEHIYMLLTIFVNKVGKHKDVPDDKYDPKELKLGIDVEMEHTDDKAIAKEIAKDHLDELSDYYTKLIKMEKESEIKKEEK